MLSGITDVVKSGMEMIKKFIPDPKAKEESTKELFRMEKEGEPQEMALKANVLIALIRAVYWWICSRKKR